MTASNIVQPLQPSISQQQVQSRPQSLPEPNPYPPSAANQGFNNSLAINSAPVAPPGHEIGPTFIIK